MPDRVQLPITAELGAQSQVILVGKKRFPRDKMGREEIGQGKRVKKDTRA